AAKQGDVALVIDHEPRVVLPGRRTTCEAAQDRELRRDACSVRLSCQDGSSHRRQAEADDEASLAERLEELPAGQAGGGHHHFIPCDACWIARMMRMCVPQRQRYTNGGVCPTPDKKSFTSSSVGIPALPRPRSQLYAPMMMPAVQ